MAEHLLDDLHIGTAGDREARRRVPKLVRVEVWDPDGCGGDVKGPSERADPQRLAIADAAEGQFVELPVLDVLGELFREETGNRHLPALMGLGRSPHEPQALDGRYRPDDDGPPAPQVKTPHPKGRHLSEAHPGVGEEEHNETVSLVRADVVAAVLARVGWEAALVGEVVDLLVGQVAMLGLVRAGEVHAVSDVTGQPTVLDCHIQDQREHAMNFGHRGRRESGRQGRDPLLDLRMGDVADADRGPLRQYLLAENACVALAGRRLQVRLPVEPSFGPVAERHLGQRRIDVRAGRLGVLDRGKEALRIDLPGERLVALGARGCAIASSPAHLSVGPLALLDVGHGSSSFSGRYWREAALDPLLSDSAPSQAKTSDRQ